MSGPRVRDVLDQRDQNDSVGRGVVLHIETTKAGRKQAVLIADAQLAKLAVQWRSRSLQEVGLDGSFIGRTVDPLRARLWLSIKALDSPADPLPALVWHSFRHGGATRAFLAGMNLGRVYLGGRWAVGSSAQHYIQVGRQLVGFSSLTLLFRYLRAIFFN